MEIKEVIERNQKNLNNEYKIKLESNFTSKIINSFIKKLNDINTINEETTTELISNIKLIISSHNNDINEWFDEKFLNDKNNLINSLNEFEENSILFDNDCVISIQNSNC